MLSRVPAILLLLLAALLRAEGPGITVAGAMSQYAQDGDGHVWAVNEDGQNGINLLVDSHWDFRHVPDLDPDCRPAALEKFEDGDVGCLWSDPHEAEDAWVLTRHRAGQSRVAKRFRAKLNGPAMLGVREGRVYITEAGRTFIAIFADNKEPEITTLPEGFFIPPAKKQSDGTVSEYYTPLCALADHSGAIWLWSPETQRQEWSWRLGGLVKVGDIVTDLKLCHVGEITPAITTLWPWDKDHLAVAAQGAGLFLLDQTTLQVKAATVPDADAFAYVGQLFHDGIAWHAVTTPQPAETKVTVLEALGNRSIDVEYRYYDRTRPTCILWRQEAGDWKQLKDGLDTEPATYRAWLRTRAGLFIGSDSGPPWFFPAIGGEPRRISSADTFPLAGVAHMFQLNDGQVLLTCPYPAACCLWPSDPPIFKEEPLRWEKFTSVGHAIQDSRGHFWCLRGVQSFVCWDGREWKQFPPPPLEAVDAGVEFVPDDRDRGWLLPAGDALTAICDFSTGKWQTFPTLREALVAQLPRGVKLSLPEAPFFEYAFSGDGRIGAFMEDDMVRLYEGHRWREWKFRDIVGPGEKLGGKPFFAPNLRFSIPVAKDVAWQWHGRAKGWRRSDHMVVPHPGTGPDREVVLLPDGTPLDRYLNGCGARDRHGVIWQLRNGIELRKLMLGRELEVFDSSELNAFRFGGGVYRALVDDAGNALLDGTISTRTHPQVFIRARLPVPDCVARLARNEEDTAHLVLGPGNVPPVWHTWRTDGGEWQSLSNSREIKLAGLLPGKHVVEVRAFNAELTPSPGTATISFVTTAAAEAQFAARLRDLSGPDLETREAAARMLKSQGVSTLPKLRAARDSAPPDVQWWLDAVIQHIERQSAAVPK